MKKQDQKHYGVVYCVTNKSNNKKYIGQTTRPFNHRIYQHKRSAKYGGERGKCTALRNALMKYGEDNFNWDIIAYGANQQDLNDLEVKYIQEFRTCERDYGYNLRYGGKGGKYSQEARENFSRNQKGRKLSEETKAKISKSTKERFATKPWPANYLASRKRQSIPIKTVIDGRTIYFESIEDAGRKMKCEPGNIMASIKRGGTCKGYRFTFVDMEKEKCDFLSYQQSFLSRAVMRLNAGENSAKTLKMKLLLKLPKHLAGLLGAMIILQQKIAMTAMALLRHLAFCVQSTLLRLAMLFHSLSVKMGKYSAPLGGKTPQTPHLEINSSGLWSPNQAASENGST